MKGRSNKEVLIVPLISISGKPIKIITVIKEKQKEKRMPIVANERYYNIPGLIENTEIYGWKETLIAAGYPMQTGEVEPSEYLRKEYKRAVKLGGTPIGSGHDNFLNGFIVQFDLIFTKQAWSEAERYHFLDFVSSCSTIHKLAKFELESCYNKYVNGEIIAIMEKLQKNYNDNPTEDNFLTLIYSNPVGFKLRARMTTNYRQLKTIYYQRRNHKLPEWREFCKWIEGLPLMEDILDIDS